jgi:acyl-CoA synthetase (AMP-forming)/AMP-acid ligase II/acyl carrier protein
LVTHNNVVRLFQFTNQWYHFNQDDVWTLFHSCAFDFSVWEIWGALIYGGKLEIVPYMTSRSPEAFYELLSQKKVTVLNQTPSAFRQLVQAEESAKAPKPLRLRYIIFGGEALEMRALKPWFERHGDQSPQLVNMYGITETTVHVTYRPLTKNDLQSGSVIGIPIPDLKVHILNAQLQPVPKGEAAEMFVGGAGLARGYLNRPALTAERFIPDPFSEEPGARLYRTGDLARFLPNGDIEYLGRIDQQVKIRGFRIELGEIESVLAGHPGIREAVVLVPEEAAGEKRLVAYLIATSTETPNVSDLRNLLRAKLPEYMVPSAFVFIDSLPLTSNGKLDRKALPAPDEAKGNSHPALVTPANALERDIAGIWHKVLQTSSIGLEQNFFDVGGDSIRLATVHADLQKLLGIQFPITDLFAHTTIRSLAAHFDSSAKRQSSSASLQDRARRQRQAFSAHRKSGS